MKYRRMKLLLKKLGQKIYELESTIQILFFENGNDLHKLEEGRNLKDVFKDVVEEAHDMLDLFVLDKNSKNFMLFMNSFHWEITRMIKSIKDDYFSILHNMKMEPSPITENLKTQSAGAGVTSSSRNSLGSNGLLDETVVGLDHDIEIIRDKLAEDTRKLDVISIVGMGGLGKTTLATKVFNDPYVGYHFNTRGWVTVSQTYEKTDLLNQILASIGVEIEPHKRDNYSLLREKLHKRLMRQRYLVVIDDIWNTQAWDDLKVIFPDHYNGSRLLITSRHKKVALHSNPYGFVHQVRCLTDEESWELLCKKVFHGHDFPDSLTGPGMQIARNCRGLPFAVVVIAGVLAKEPVIKESWERISQSCSSLIVKGHTEALALSLNYLPSHLRNCFLYLAGFPEDYRFQVERLIWLWIAEGFIQEDENRSLEETAIDYLMELVDKNLVVVHDRKFNRARKTFSVRDVLRELSSEIARKERFSIQVPGWENFIIAPYKTSRLFISRYTRYVIILPPWPPNEYIALKCSRSWRLLTVLDIKQCDQECFPEKITLLVNLRYLAIRISYRDFQSTICDLKSLQTLIIEGFPEDPFKWLSFDSLVPPKTISNLVNLRHLQCRQTIMFPPLQMPFMNLQTISGVVLGHKPTSWVNYFPVVKKLSCSIYRDWKYYLKSLTFLKVLKIRSKKSKRWMRGFQENSIEFPASLKRLTLEECRLPWSNMSEIQSLPNLEVLKLLRNAFVGPQWDAGEESFQQLKFLKLSCLDIQQWKASAINFPCLKQLALYDCFSLNGIPFDINYLPPLEDIQIKGCRDAVTKSAYEIQEEQHAVGNYDLKIRAVPSKLHFLMENLEEILTKTGTETGTSLNRLTRPELEALGLPTHNPPAHHHIRRSRIAAHHHIRKSRIWNDGRSKYDPIKEKL